MMKNKWQLFPCILLALSLFATAACQKDDDDTDMGNEQEVITTVQLTFTPTAGGGAITFVFSDTDGPGGQAPLVDQISLSANTNYEMTVDFIDASTPGNPVFITDEVQDEAEEHLVCYIASGLAPLPTAKDQDSDGNPLGLVADVRVGAAGSGMLTIVLKHEPVKTTADPCSTGDTDVEAAFPVVVQ